MKIPPKQLESTQRRLHHLVDERTSAPWASYGDEDISVNKQNREDIERIQTAADVLEWLQNQRGRKLWASGLPVWIRLISSLFRARTIPMNETKRLFVTT